MSALPRIIARVLVVGVGVPAVTCGALLAAMPGFVADASLARALTAKRVAELLGVLAVAAVVQGVAVLRGVRQGASVSARLELVALPRATALLWGALAGIAFTEGALSHPSAAEGTVALVSSALLALAAVALHPAMRVAVRPALDEAALTSVPPTAGERLALRTAVAVGVPSGAAALLAVLSVAAQGRALIAEQSERALSTWGAALAVPAVQGEPAEGPALASRVLAAGGAMRAREALVEPRAASLPSRGWAVAFALAAGLLGALIGRRVGRDAADALTSATARIDAMSDRTPAVEIELSDDAVLDVRALVDALDALSESLAQMAADQRRALSTRRDAARLRALVFAGVSHDLRGPLNAVLGFAGILELGADGPLTEGQRESVEAVRRGGEELLRLVDDLLDAARIEAGRLQLEPSPTPLEALLAAATEDSDARVRSADVRVPAVAVEGVAELSVFVEASRTARALAALLTYARLRPGASDAQVSLRIVDVDAARVSMRLHSPGATPEDAVLAQVFEPFDLPPQGARVRAGVGLAVGVASRLIALQGGSAEALPAPEGGMIFALSLPRGDG